MAHTEPTVEGSPKPEHAAHDSIPMSMIANRLNKSLEAEFFRRLGEAGHSVLRMPHTMLLENLPQGGARSGVLASALGISKQAVGEIVDDLEAAEYISRVADPADRRAKLIVLSPKGAAAFGEVFAILSKMDREFSAAVGAERYAEARATFIQLILHLERDRSVDRTESSH
jgi:DNA-binding MarR family transcriptional regulator